MHVLTNDNIFTSLSHFGSVMGSPDYACKHSDTLAAVHAAIIPRSWKKKTAFLELGYLLRPQLCQCVRVERMMCLAD